MTAASAIAGSDSALMVGEAHHRFFNSLQTVVAATNSILRREIGDPDLRERVAALQDGVVRLADINRRLAGPFGPESVSVPALEQHFADLARAFDRSTALLTITVRGRIQSPNSRRLLLLLLSELMTNAIKHSSVHQQLCVRITLVAATDNCRLHVSSNTLLGGNANQPRVAAELAEAAGGALNANAVSGEYRVAVLQPATGRSIEV